MLNLETFLLTSKYKRWRSGSLRLPPSPLLLPAFDSSVAFKKIPSVSLCSFKMLFYVLSHWLSYTFCVRWRYLCPTFSPTLSIPLSHLHVDIAKVIYISLSCNHKQMYFAHKLIVNIENNKKKSLFTLLWLWKFCSLLYYLSFFARLTSWSQCHW